MILASLIHSGVSMSLVCVFFIVSSLLSSYPRCLQWSLGLLDDTLCPGLLVMSFYLFRFSK